MDGDWIAEESAEDSGEEGDELKEWDVVTWVSLAGWFAGLLGG